MNTLYINATIITVDEKRRVFRNGFILVGDDRILAIDSDYALQNTQLPEDVRKVDLERKIVIPGLINGHVHLIQALMRGLAEDMDLHTWASCAIWPLEVAYEKNDGYISARLAMAEMLKSGTTCFLEPMLPASAGFEGVCRAVEETGIRACLVCFNLERYPSMLLTSVFSGQTRQGLEVRFHCRYCRRSRSASRVYDHRECYLRA